MISKIIFYFAMISLLYAYIGYILVLWIISRLKDRPVSKTDITPSVSIIVTVHNEEKNIRKKIENTISLNYPRDKLDIIVASDCSTDNTDRIVSEYNSDGVKLVRLSIREGKTEAQNKAILQAKGDVVIFTDASTTIEKDSLLFLVRGFSDSTVGCVTSEDRHKGYKSGERAESSYVRYEMFLRRLGSKVDSVVGMSGCFYGVRRNLCTLLRKDVTRDFATPLIVRKAGLRAICEPEASGYLRVIDSTQQEFNRKLRTVIAGITTLFYLKGLLNPLKYGLFSWQLFSHKLLRWSVPFLCILLMGSSLTLWKTHSVYKLLVIFQLGFYSLGVLSLFTSNQKYKLFRFLRYYMSVNLAILIGWIKYFRGYRVSHWDPSNRET